MGAGLGEASDTPEQCFSGAFSLRDTSSDFLPMDDSFGVTLWKTLFWWTRSLSPFIFSLRWPEGKVILMLETYVYV